LLIRIKDPQGTLNKRRAIFAAEDLTSNLKAKLFSFGTADYDLPLYTKHGSYHDFVYTAGPSIINSGIEKVAARGFSGSPLIDEEGRVYGIVSAVTQGYNTWHRARRHAQYQNYHLYSQEQNFRVFENRPVEAAKVFTTAMTSRGLFFFNNKSNVKI
jgi:hypothetical protein